MKNLLVIFILLFTFSACEEPETMDEGTITGLDMALCPCCGGTFIEIEKVNYRINNFPDTSFAFTANDLPLDVWIDWMADTTACIGNEIIVHSIVKK